MTETKYLVSTSRLHDLENLLEHYELLSKEDARHYMIKFGGLQPNNPNRALTMYEITLTKVNPHPSFRPHRKVGHQLCELYLQNSAALSELPLDTINYNCEVMSQFREILESYGFTKEIFTKIFSSCTFARNYTAWYFIYRAVLVGEDDEIFQWSKFWA